MRILSLGAGVQSSTLLLMALNGEIELFDALIFADTQAEPNPVYEYLDWLEEQVEGRIPFYRETGGNLEESILSGCRTATAPFYVLNKQTLPNMPPESGGMLWRQCTQEYKLAVIRRKVREIYLDAGKPHIYQVIGISLDEQSRMKASGVKYITNVYPLVEKRISRQSCVFWLEQRGYPIPPKSACYFCPYTSNSRWQEMKTNDPETFARAVAFDARLRDKKLPGVTGDAYVHRSFIPLSEVQFREESQLDFAFGFANECEGMCGV